MKKEGEIDMALLEVKNVKKIYTTRFGGNKVEALRDVNFWHSLTARQAERSF